MHDPDSFALFLDGSNVPASQAEDGDALLVLPRTRVGMPVAPAEVCARTFSASEAASADPKTNSKNSRLDFEFIVAPIKMNLPTRRL